MSEMKKGSDLSLLEDVLRQHEKDSTSLITILQEAQAIYGYLPEDVIYHVAARTGNSPARVSRRSTATSACSRWASI